MKKLILILLVFALALTVTASPAAAGDNARRPAILASADRVVELQRTDSSWEGTWYWYVGNTYNATNLTGVTALGLLEAYRDTKDVAYLNSAIAAAGFIQAHLGAGATQQPAHWPRPTAPDIIFLHQLSQVTGDPSYAARATDEWNNITSTYPTAGALDTVFRTVNRRSAWDIAFFLEAAYLSEDTVWADEAAAILTDLGDTFYYGTDNWWYALNVAGAIRALVFSGYAGQYSAQIGSLLNSLVALVDDTDGVGGYVQDTAYAVLAFRTVGGSMTKYANDLGRWLASQQDVSGGWIEPDGREYPEANGEALRALAATIGTNVTIDGFGSGIDGSLNSAWAKSSSEKAEPYSGD